MPGSFGPDVKAKEEEMRRKLDLILECMSRMADSMDKIAVATENLVILYQRM